MGAVPQWGPECSSASHVPGAEGVCGPLAGMCRSWTWSQATDPGTEGPTQEPEPALSAASLRAVLQGTRKDPSAKMETGSGHPEEQARGPARTGP